jgi:photosystem II stability/assembly factor-like uncharacterized protein
MSFSRRSRPRLWTIFAVLALVLASLRGAEAGLNRWTPIGPSAGYLITGFTADPHDPAILYAKTFNTGVWRSGDGGDSWVSMTSSLPGFANGFAVDAVAPGVLYVTVEDLASGALSVWSSGDRGDTWTKVFQGPPTGGIAKVGLVVDPFVSGTLYQIGDGQVSKSIDGGRTWACFSVFFPTCSGARLIVAGFTVDPQSSERLYATNNLGLLYMSTDGGVSWTDGARIQPLFGAAVDRLVVSPTDPEIVYAGFSYGQTPGGGRPCLARSDDRGESWKGLLPDVQCSPFSVDPEDGRILRVLVGPERRLWTSRDAGETWTQSGPAPELGQILADPAHPGVLLLAGAEGLFRSEDEGAHWSRWGRRGFNNTGLRVLLGSAEAPGVLYASLSEQPQAGLATNFNPLPRPLQKSADAGRTWTDLPLRGVAALAIDPRNPRHLYAVSDLFDNGRLTSRVHESADGGLSWRLVKERPFTGFTSTSTPPRVTGLVVDPMDSRVLFASTSFGSGLFRSTDGGRTWSPVTRGLPVRTRCGLSGCPFNATRDIVFDRNPRILYVVFDGVVYRSIDGGESWARSDGGVLPPTLVALAADPERSGVLYAAGAIPTTSAGFVSAVFRSVDRGRHWTREAAFASPVLDLTVSRAGAYAATAKDGVYHSTVPGNWVSYVVDLPGGSSNLLAYDPQVPARVYAGTPRNGAYVARLVNP